MGFADAVAGFLHWAAGDGATGSAYLLSRWLFLRLLGVIFLIAFLSLWVQVKGLIGSDGILPVKDFLSVLRSYAGAERYRLFPTVFWWNASDAALQMACAVGVLCSLLLLVGVAPLWSLIILGAAYLSLTVAGQDFLSFQWDILLLEVGFAAIFLAPTGLLPGLARESAVPPLTLFLLLWILFRLLFESGVVKLTSGDPAWRDLTVLRYHYETQPLPTPLSWYMHWLPMGFQKVSVLFMYAVELALPFLLFGPVPLRIAACVGIAVLQLLIMATGNYTFFNLLTIAPALLAIPDRVWLRMLPSALVRFIGYGAVAPPVPLPWAGIIAAVAAVLVLVGGKQLIETAFPQASFPGFVGVLEEWLQPFRSVNSYGLFRVMTRERPEIIVEGSDDGKTWLPYAFPAKAGDVDAAPRFVAPHQPRLDWQMWFAALGSYRSEPPVVSYVEPWFQQFLLRLLQGSPDVLALLKTNPFPAKPPRYVRSLLYRYSFTRPGEGNAWWKRELLGEYTPVLSLQ